MQETDPIDSYTTQTILHTMKTQGINSNDFKVFLSNEYGDRLVSMQRVADIAGLAELDYNTYLSIHRIYGPWIAFRAVYLQLSA